MGNEIISSKMKNLFFESLKKYFVLSMIVLALLLLMRFGELIFYSVNHTLPVDFFLLLKTASFIDIMLWLQWLFLPCIIFIPLYLINRKLALAFTCFCILLFFTVHLILVSYFNSSLVLLGSDIFGYSVEDINQTVGASGSVSLSSITLFLIVLALVSTALYYLPKRIFANKYIALALPVISIIFFVSQEWLNMTSPRFDSDFANSIVDNKSAHFYQESQTYFFNSGYDIDIYADSYLAGTRNDTTLTRKYIDAAYPFLHKRDRADVLSPFFKPKDKAPNLVIILVEGLGRAFSNKGAYLGSFTPFLDSLSQKSLYWKNFLSNGGRTFAVLPSIIGSLPFAENGFLALNDKMPKETSLINLLKNSGYETSFFYGGDSGFDLMQTYLKKNGVDNIYDEKTFPPNYTKLPSTNNFSWGYGDRELYDFYLEKKQLDSLTPHLDILLTLTTHSPFLITERDRYSQLFKKRMNTLGLSPEEQKAHEKYQKQYATLLYADQALQNLFKAYKRRPDFKNTLFIITGDHRIPEIPMSTKIDRYHVPLIIYSPMLVRNAEIASISSHFDIAPSLLNYLSNNHNIKIPDETSFLGSGLDTVRRFRNIHTIPLKQTKTDLVDFVMETYHLNKADLYEIDPTMGEDPIDNPEKKAKLQAAFQRFKSQNSEISKGASLIPDSIYASYISVN